MKKFFKILPFIELILAVIFLSQAFNLINIIPLGFALALIGTSGNFFKMFWGVFIGYAAYFILIGIAEIIYIGSERKSIIESLIKKAIKLFIIFWLTFFIGGFFSAIRIFPVMIGSEYLNFYLFWFLFIDFFFRIVEIKVTLPGKKKT